jgi:hypothetical protein
VSSVWAWAPSLFEGRAIAAVVEAVREHQRLGLGQLEHRNVAEVAGDLGQGQSGGYLHAHCVSQPGVQCLDCFLNDYDSL